MTLRCFKRQGRGDLRPTPKLSDVAPDCGEDRPARRHANEDLPQRRNRTRTQTWRVRLCRRLALLRRSCLADKLHAAITNTTCAPRTRAQGSRTALRAAMSAVASLWRRAPPPPAGTTSAAPGVLYQRLRRGVSSSPPCRWPPAAARSRTARRGCRLGGSGPCECL